MTAGPAPSWPLSEPAASPGLIWASEGPNVLQKLKYGFHFANEEARFPLEQQSETNRNICLNNELFVGHVQKAEPTAGGKQMWGTLVRAAHSVGMGLVRVWGRGRPGPLGAWISSSRESNCMLF